MSLKNFSHKNSNSFEELTVNEYVSLKELEVKKPYDFVGFFFNSKAEYPHYVLVTPDNVGVSLPVHLNSLFDDIKEDKEAVQEIKEGKATFEVYEYNKTVKAGKKEIEKTFRSIDVALKDD